MRAAGRVSVHAADPAVSSGARPARVVKHSVKYTMHGSAERAGPVPPAASAPHPAFRRCRGSRPRYTLQGGRPPLHENAQPPAPVPHSAGDHVGGRGLSGAAADGRADAALVRTRPQHARRAGGQRAVRFRQPTPLPSRAAASCNRCSTARCRTSAWSPSACARSTAQMLRRTRELSRRTWTARRRRTSPSSPIRSAHRRAGRCTWACTP